MTAVSGVFGLVRPRCEGCGNRLARSVLRELRQPPRDGRRSFGLGVGRCCAPRESRLAGDPTWVAAVENDTLRGVNSRRSPLKGATTPERGVKLMSRTTRRQRRRSAPGPRARELRAGSPPSQGRNPDDTDKPGAGKASKTCGSGLRPGPIAGIVLAAVVVGGFADFLVCRGADTPAAAPATAE